MNFTKSAYIFLLAVLLTACSEKPTSVEDVPREAKDTFALHEAPDETEVQEEAFADDEYVEYHVVIVDSSLNYAALRSKMFEVSALGPLPIDTMDRLYDEEKQVIVLPDDYEDEMYAGGYYPRLHASEFLSIEYLSLYKKEASDKSMALVAGIYEDAQRADSTLAVLKAIDTKAFVVKALLYSGCMH